MFGWALPLAGMTWYAIGRRVFGLAVQKADPRRDGDGGPAGCRNPAKHPLDQWPVTEAALRLDGIRTELDRVIGCWQQRTAAGGAITSLDPGGQWLIRLFTVRRAAADGAQRVIELAGQITGQARPVGHCWQGWAGDNQRADRGGPAGAASADAGLPGRVAAGASPPSVTRP